MPDYRRNRAPGWNVLLYCELLDRRSNLLAARIDALRVAVRQLRASRGERGIWQRRYWEHTIRDDRDFAAHMDCTHFNPVKHGLVAHPADWPHSSFQRCVNIGLYPAGWRGGSEEPQNTGERL